MAFQNDMQVCEFPTGTRGATYAQVVRSAHGAAGRGGAHGAAVRGGAPSAAVRGGAHGAAVRGGAPSAAVRGGAPSAAVRGGALALLFVVALMVLLFVVAITLLDEVLDKFHDLMWASCDAGGHGGTQGAARWDDYNKRCNQSWWHSDVAYPTDYADDRVGCAPGAAAAGRGTCGAAVGRGGAQSAAGGRGGTPGATAVLHMVLFCIFSFVSLCTRNQYVVRTPD